MRWGLHFLLCVGVVGLTACGSRTSEQEDRRDLAQIYALIDKGNLPEAEVRLQTRLVTNARDTEALVALASVELQRAGLGASRFYEFAQSWVETGSFSDPLRWMRTRSNNNNKKRPPTATLIWNVVEGMNLFLHAYEKFERLPRLDDQQAVHTLKAIQWLQRIESPSAGQALFRALLKAVHLKYVLEGGRFVLLAPLRTGGELLCTARQEELREGLQHLFTAIGTVIEDLQLAFPVRQANWQKLRQRLQEIAADIQGFQLNRSLNIEEFELEQLVEFIKDEFKWKWSCD